MLYTTSDRRAQAAARAIERVGTPGQAAGFCAASAGSYSEYSCDIDYIPSDKAWQAGTHDPEDSFYLWGPNPAEDFAFNYESPSANSAP